MFKFIKSTNNNKNKIKFFLKQNKFLKNSNYSTNNQPQSQSSQFQPSNLLKPAEYARSLVKLRKSGTLTTASLQVSQDQVHQTPLFGSLMPYIVDSFGKPFFGLRSTEQHTQNLQMCEAASLQVFSLTPKEINPIEIPTPRVSLAGIVKQLDDREQIDKIKQEFLEMHPAAKNHIDFYDMYYLEPQTITIIKPKGQPKQQIIEPKNYFQADIDPLANNGRYIIEAINKKLPNELISLCNYYANESIVKAFIYTVDAYGFNVLANNLNQESDNLPWIDIRLPFPFKITKTEDCIYAIKEAIEKISP
eukprot:TRINITY_DN1561_c3_g1_i1.p1 TRINITY_DN1561_c3_g1~~TRINITY_DN1561_c3_g1_i1.p1  ORF type:complete len:305 (-),score=99.56 TRINITY_DN1561_c3_g1_i1:47-961(-)